MKINDVIDVDAVGVGDVHAHAGDADMSRVKENGSTKQMAKCEPGVSTTSDLTPLQEYIALREREKQASEEASAAELKLREQLKFKVPDDARVPAQDDVRDGLFSFPNPTATAAALGSASGSGPGSPKSQPADDGGDDGSGWRLFAFKDGELCVGPIAPGANGRSWILIGRDAEVCDVVAAHPSVSAQHAVIQFRAPEKEAIAPFIMDLSRKGTQVNGEKVKRAKFYPLSSGDVFALANSTREYVIVRDL